jgi:hypothetical protein
MTITNRSGHSRECQHLLSVELLLHSPCLLSKLQHETLVKLQVISLVLSFPTIFALLLTSLPVTSLSLYFCLHSHTLKSFSATPSPLHPVSPQLLFSIMTHVKYYNTFYMERQITDVRDSNTLVRTVINRNEVTRNCLHPIQNPSQHKISYDAHESYEIH